MKLEEQVTSLEISKHLKELGVKQESLYMWAPDSKGYAMEVRLKRKISFERSEFVYSAFTVAELGILLPEWIMTNGKGRCQLDRFGFGYPLNFNNEEFLKFLVEKDQSEADARGKMCIFLLENGLIKI